MSMSDRITADPNQSSHSVSLLTVVIPHFNQKDFLPRAVASVLSGESRGIEIIIDDGYLHGIRPITPPSFRAEYLDPQSICHRIKSTDHWIASTTAVFRTDLLRAVGGFDVTLRVFCDIIVARILAFEHGFVYVPGIRAVFRVAASTFSGSTRLDQRESSRQLAIARERLSNSIVAQLAPDYPDLFARRLRFSGTVGRVLALAWLTLRLRPFSPLHLIVHLLRNKVTLIRNRRRVADWIRRMDDARRQIMTGADIRSCRSAQ